ncbi:MAG TPA: PspC domain-containing protein [Candidatus Limnocylindrales bacterium]
MNPRRLYRCRHDRQLAGVAAGMAEYLDLDPTVVRILWILSAFVGGFTIVLYIILAFVMPLEPLPVVAGTAPTATDAEAAVGMPTTSETTTWTAPVGQAPVHEHRTRGEGRIGFGLGVLLVVFGAIALVGPAFPGWVTGIALGPAFLVAIGVALVIVSVRRGATES